MAKHKLQRFEELTRLERVFQFPFPLLQSEHGLRGNWNEKVFDKARPMVLELGCGRGEYTVELARENTDKNFVGVDVKGARLWRGAKTINEENMLNAAFLRVRIEWLNQFFADQEVNEIWVTFPDPQPQLSRENRRLTNARFMQIYRQVLKKDGLFHLKTDDRGLFEYTLEVLQNESGTLEYHTFDLYRDKPDGFRLDIQTTYEKIFLKEGKPINYLRFRMA